MKKKFILLYLIVLWMIVIFLFSSMNSNNSNDKSMGIIENAIVTITKVLNINISDKQIEKIVNNLNYPIRKCAHVTEYLIFAILLMSCLYNKNYTKTLYLIIAILFSYACTDEFHQMFTGRTSSLLDVILDTLGGSLGIILYLKFNKSEQQ